MLQLLVLLLIPGLFGNADAEGHYHYRRVCEGRDLTIDCGSKEIDIRGASYGRTKKGLCVFRDLDHNINCLAGNSMSVVRSQCQCQKSCTLHATNSAFGDPCFGTEKYLEVSYNCVEKPCTLLQVCEHHSHAIHCPSSERINILSANYGRLTGGQVCGGGPIKTTHCGAVGELAKVQHDCQGRSTCILHATNGKFGDPCFGTYKYLEVSYNCVEQPGTLLQVCEHRSHAIHCPSSKRIKILSANYGRLTGGQVCGGGPIKTTNCGAVGELAKVQHDCQGRSTCILHASNGKFGDPCPGTYKYLEVRYICE